MLGLILIAFGFFIFSNKESDPIPLMVPEVSPDIQMTISGCFDEYGEPLPAYECKG